ncbi:type 2 lanthipeptide synthetase LanM family protein [Streptomyces spiramenti]|uniref:Type 2 lantipeptide synthetase LanM n=1 Tax=Streptomyces spiramenti TaxID=2720606 RepID=A0ABX1ANI5_9ACTN|nr:type 2 lantipeptide synthetase LanM [Streptomyces spiramenti]
MTSTSAATQTDRVPPQPLPPLWWARGLTLRERLAAPGRPAPADGPTVTAWLEALTGLDTAGTAARLTALGVPEALGAALWHESPTALGERAPRPPWAVFVEEALRPAPATPTTPTDGDWREAFAAVLRPFSAHALDRLRGSYDPATGDAERHAVEAAFGPWLVERLVNTAARTLVRELHTARTSGLLTGATPAERFGSFTESLGDPGTLAALLARYPVLARVLAELCTSAADAAAELADRYTRDRPRIVAGLWTGRDPGPLVRVELALGDTHLGGRAVARLHFRDGARVLYKPRPLDHHAVWDAAVSWLNAAVPDLSLRTAATVRSAGYGWMEHVDHLSCRTVGDVDRFYRRQGALLALAHALCGADLHRENLIAHGDQPVLVDAETLFHPDLPLPNVTGDDPAAARITASVYQTCVLPQVVLGDHGQLDVSAVGGAGHAPWGVEGWEEAGTDRMRRTLRPAPAPPAQNQPQLAGGAVGHTDYHAALVNGFHDGYRAVESGRAGFLAEDGPLRRAEALECRVVARPSRLYATLLEEALHPGVLGDALLREAVFALLWTEAVGDPARLRLAEAETADLWAGDLPLFRHRPASRAVLTSTGERLPDLLGEAASVTVRARIEAMDEMDRRCQEWVITASLATADDAGRTGRHRAEPLPPGGTGAPAEVPDPSLLLAAACRVADDIVARAQHGGGRANWLGVEPVEDAYWTVLPMGAGLAHGYPGVALFLAELGALTGSARYTDLARAAVLPLPALVRTLAERPELSRAVGPGGFSGLGGIAYALSRLETLLGTDSPAALPNALTALAVAATPAGSAPALSVADGIAGALAATTAVAEDHDLPLAERLADDLADRLLAAVDGPSAAGPEAGFARGTTGIAWALLRHAERRPGASGAAGAAGAAGETGRRLLRRAHRALEAAPPDLSWCSGTPGWLLAATDGPRTDPWGLGPELLASASDRLAARPATADLTPCHGEAGSLEALAVLAAGGDTAAAQRLAHRQGLVLGALRRDGHRCATPGRVPSPGLLDGLAGVGHTLLRLGFPGTVPSVLLLAPHAGKADHRRGR